MADLEHAETADLVRKKTFPIERLSIGAAITQVQALTWF